MILSIEDKEALWRVETLNQFVNVRMYQYTDEIFSGLWQMNIANKRFRKIINKHWEDTAEYVCECIKSYWVLWITV